MPEEIDDPSMHVPVEEVPPPTAEDDTSMHVPVVEE
tara:strand:+ start:408 stop:515 length:108 start_codon:yes stop_codon:yes gene_type:complete